MPKLPTFPPSGTLDERLAHPCFQQPTDDNVKVWRYMNLAKFIALVRTNTLRLARLDQMADPYEGSTTSLTAAGVDRFLKRLDGTRGYHELSAFFKRAHAKTFVSCWHANEHESEAMWRLYGRTGGGVAIQSTYGNLVRSVADQNEVFVGLVQYIDYETDRFPDADMFHPVMHKRASFSHEHEVRLVRYCDSSPEPDTMPLTLPMAWSVEAHCEHIYIDPYAPAHYYEAVHAVVEAMVPSLLSRLAWSRMKAEPLFGAATANRPFQRTASGVR